MVHLATCRSWTCFAAWPTWRAATEDRHLAPQRVHVAEQIARLLPVIVVHPVIPMGSRALERERRLGKIRLVVPEPRAVRMIGERAAQIAVSAQLAVA